MTWLWKSHGVDKTKTSMCFFKQAKNELDSFFLQEVLEGVVVSCCKFAWFDIAMTMDSSSISSKICAKISSTSVWAY